MSAFERFRLRRIARIIGGSTPGPAAENWDGGVPFFTPPDLRSVHGGVVMETGRTLTDLGVRTGSTRVTSGSVILSKRAPIGYVARLGVDGAFNQGCLVLELNASRVDPRFLTWLLSTRSEELNALGRGTTFVELSAGDLADVEVAIPNVGMQRAIADYLDRETARIDMLIEEQQRLVDLMGERRQAVVSHVLASASDGSVVLRRLVDVIDCAHVTAEFVDGDTRFPVASIRECSRAYVDLSSCNYTTAEFFALLRASGRAPRVGDLLFIRNVSVGLVAEVAQGTPDFAVGQETVLLRRSSEVDPTFLRYALGSRWVAHAIESAMIGSTFRRINVSAIRSLPVPDVPLSAQPRIAAYLDGQTAKIDTLIAETERFIELAKERRSALITAAVTGQIDVRDVA